MKKFYTLSVLLVCFSVFAQPANDDCAGAINLIPALSTTCNNPFTATVANATPSAQATTCTGVPDDDVWFTFTATSPVHKIVVDGGFNYALYSGTCGSLGQIQCGIAGSAPIRGLTIGTTYYIRAYSNQAGPPAIPGFSICIITLPSIAVSTTQYTPEALVTEVFGGSPCTPVTNVSISPGVSVGYFAKAGSVFPFNHGLVISTGNAIDAIGPNTGLTSGNNGAGTDSNLVNAIPPPGTNGAYTNAAKVEFDFTAETDQFSLNFIFASDEYGMYQCNFHDAFAFLVTDQATGLTSNIAVMPGTNTPITSGTIRNWAYNNSCPSVNSAYFSAYFAPDIFDLVAPTAFNGYTVPITAEATLIPGHTYHFKMVIADYLDQLGDSAVFIEAGSLNIGQVNPALVELQSAAGDLLCDGGGTLLSVDGLPDYVDYSWTLNGAPVGTNSSSLSTNEAGDYVLTISWGTTTSCTASYPITLSTGQTNDLSGLPQPEIVINEVNSDEFGDFNLTAYAQQLLAYPQLAGYTVAFYENEYDALTGQNPLPGTYTSSPGEIIVIFTSPSGCTIFQYVLLFVNDITPITLNPQYTLSQCEPNTDGLAEFDLTAEGDAILGGIGLDPNLFSVAFYLNTAALTADTPLPGNYTNTVAPQQTILVKVWENAVPSNSATAQLQLSVEGAPLAYPVLTPIVECDYDGFNEGFVSFFDLTPAGAEALGPQSPAAFSVGYYTSLAAANEGDTTSPDYIATPSNFTNTTVLGQTIWIRVSNTTGTSGCYAVTPLTIQVALLPEAVITAPNYYFCQDFSTGEILSTVVLSLNSNEGDTVTWYFNEDDITIDNTANQFIATVDGTYTAIITSGSAAACTSYVSNTFEVVRTSPAVILGETGYTYDGATLTILVIGYGTYQYALNSEGPWQESNVFTNVVPGTYTVYVKDMNGCDTLLLEIDATLSVQNAKFDNLAAYPNPVTDVLTVSAAAEIKSVEVYNALGQLVIIKNTSGTTATVNMQGLQSGVYMVKVAGENTSGLLKIIKE